MKKNIESKGIYQWNNQSERIKDSTAGITLIALVITIIVLLILARNKYIYVKSVTIILLIKHQLQK